VSEGCCFCRGKRGDVFEAGRRAIDLDAARGQAVAVGALLADLLVDLQLDDLLLLLLRALLLEGGEGA